MLKPYDVFWASVIFFPCIVVILTTLLRNSAGVGDRFLMYGAILAYVRLLHFSRMVVFPPKESNQKFKRFQLTSTSQYL